MLYKHIYNMSFYSACVVYSVLFWVTRAASSLNVCLCSQFKTTMLNTYLKHVTYNLFLGCSFTDMTRRFMDCMCIVYCCNLLVRCSYVYVVLFSIWGCILRCLVVVCCDFLCFD